MSFGGVFAASTLGLAAPDHAREQGAFGKGCGSFAIETKAQSFHQIDGVLSVPTARIRGDIDTPAGYLVHPRQV